MSPYGCDRIPVHHGYRDEKVWPRGFLTYFTENELIGGCEWVDEIIIRNGFFEVYLHTHPVQIQLTQYRAGCSSIA